MQKEKESEYQVSIARNDSKNTRELAFAFRTLREFTTFQYRLQVENSSNPESNHYQFKIGGMIMPLTAMPSTGHAVATMNFPFPGEGVYTVEFLKKSQRNTFTVEITGDDMKIVEIPQDKKFIELLVRRD